MDDHERTAGLISAETLAPLLGVSKARLYLLARDEIVPSVWDDRSSSISSRSASGSRAAARAFQAVGVSEGVLMTRLHPRTRTTAQTESDRRDKSDGTEYEYRVDQHYLEPDYRVHQGQRRV